MSVLSIGILDSDSSIPSTKQLVSPTGSLRSSLLTNPKFYLYMLHGLFSFFAFLLPQQFIPSQMMSVGLGQWSGAKAIGCLAFANLIGRLSSGIIMDYPKIGVIKAYILSHVVSGLTIISLQFCKREECAMLGGLIDLRYRQKFNFGKVLHMFSKPVLRVFFAREFFQV